MDAADLERLERWARSLAASPLGDPAPGTENTTSHPELRAMSPGQKGPPEPPAAVNMEAGMRVCPRCRKPLHMSATVCRTCGEPVPRR
jgi:ribosomal protein L40E